jgi:hypothetical protein
MKPDIEAALDVLSRIIEWNDSHGEGTPALAILRTELTRLYAIEAAAKDWREWRDRNGIQSQSAHEAGILAALNREDTP